MWWRGAAALYCVALVRGDALVEFNYDNTMMVGQDSTEFKGCAQRWRGQQGCLWNLSTNF